jgi:putative FmdB family regulatory protein
MKYDYDCPKCGVIEIDKKISDPEIEKCPTCESEIKRKWTATPFLTFPGACGKIGKR